MTTGAARAAGAATPTLAGDLAEFIVGLRWDALPDAVVAHTKLLLLDTPGAALAGVHTDEGRAAREAARWFGGTTGMSLPYSVAVAWIAGRAGLTEYEEPWIHHPAVRTFMPRVTLSADPALPEGSEAHMTVQTRDGRRFERHVPFARGAPENPLSLEEVIAKYEELAPRALAPDAVREVREAVFALESPGHLPRLQDALGRPR